MLHTKTELAIKSKKNFNIYLFIFCLTQFDFRTLFVLISSLCPNLLMKEATLVKLKKQHRDKVTLD
jgi:hypothetical protein